MICDPAKDDGQEQCVLRFDESNIVDTVGCNAISASAAAAAYPCCGFLLQICSPHFWVLVTEWDDAADHLQSQTECCTCTAIDNDCTMPAMCSMQLGGLLQSGVCTLNWCNTTSMP